VVFFGGGKFSAFSSTTHARPKKIPLCTPFERSEKQCV
jgi:hypothetical protein